MTAMPAHADSLTNFPGSNAHPHFINSSGNLMTRDAWISEARPLALFGELIAVADSACLNLDPDFVLSGSRDRPIHELEIASRPANLSRFHARHGCTS